MKNEFSNAKSASAQTSTCRKTHGVSKLLFAILLSVVLFGGAMFLLFANNSAPVSTALAANSLKTLPTTLTEAPTFTYDSSAGTVTGTDQTINGYNFKDDVYRATTSTNKTIGGVEYPYVVTLTKYTPTTPTQVVVPSQMIINGNTYQVVIDSSSNKYNLFFVNSGVVTNISFASIAGTKVLATDCQRMFFDCSSLTSLDLSSFDTSSVTNMYRMFGSCSSLTSLDISNFDMSNVTYNSDMFSYCTSLETLKCTNMKFPANSSSLFKGLSVLKTLDLSNADTSKVTAMAGMFRDCSNLTSLDLSNFNTSNVTGMWGYVSQLFQPYKLGCKQF